MATIPQGTFGTTTADSRLVSKAEERKVIFASSLGTVFEWYDFYLYATLAPFFAALFFPKGNDTAALLSAFAAYGRLKIILAGCLIAALTYFPLFKALTHYVNPALETYQTKTTISVAGTNCNFHLFVGPWSKFSDCDRTRDFMTKQGLSFTSIEGAAGSTVVTRINDTSVEGLDEKKLTEALKASGYPGPADKSRINYPMTLLILFVMLIYVTMCTGRSPRSWWSSSPPTSDTRRCRCRITSANGWFGGMLPLTATAMVAASGNIYYGLWYPIVVAVVTLVIGALFLRDTHGVKLQNT